MTQLPSIPRRPLTQDENFVLEQIRDMYGPQNSEDQVFFTERNEAALLVTDRNGVQAMWAVLTNLGAWYADGTIASVQELREKWLTPG